MTAKVSTPRLVLAFIALVAAWAPAATLARPGTEASAFATNAAAQAQPAAAQHPASEGDRDSVVVPAS